MFVWNFVYRSWTLFFPLLTLRPWRGKIPTFMLSCLPESKTSISLIKKIRNKTKTFCYSFVQIAQLTDGNNAKFIIILPIASMTTIYIWKPRILSFLHKIILQWQNQVDCFHLFTVVHDVLSLTWGKITIKNSSS